MMENLLDGIRKAKKEEIGELVKAALDRYRELYPDWEVITVAIEKNRNRNEQLDRIIALLEKMKTSP